MNGTREAAKAKRKQKAVCTTMKRHAVPIIAVLLLLLPVLYIATYAALVTPYRGPVVYTVLGCGFRPGYQVHANYRTGDLSKLFLPIEHVDRRLRPDAWIDPREVESQRELEQLKLTLEARRRALDPR